MSNVSQIHIFSFFRQIYFFRLLAEEKPEEPAIALFQGDEPANFSLQPVTILIPTWTRESEKTIVF
jgi:hypothetical protein